MNINRIISYKIVNQTGTKFFKIWLAFLTTPKIKNF